MLSPECVVSVGGRGKGSGFVRQTSNPLTFLKRPAVGSSRLGASLSKVTGCCWPNRAAKTAHLWIVLFFFICCLLDIISLQMGVTSLSCRGLQPTWLLHSAVQFLPATSLGCHLACLPCIPQPNVPIVAQGLTLPRPHSLAWSTFRSHSEWGDSKTGLAGWICFWAPPPPAHLTDAWSKDLGQAGRGQLN